MLYLSSSASVDGSDSVVHSVPLVLHSKSPSSAASNDRIAISNANSDSIQIIQRPEPLDVDIGQTLTAAIRRFSGVQPTTEKSHGFSNLEDALTQAAVIVRYNAKWLAESEIVALLQCTIDAAATTSTSAELSAAVNLVDTVTVYSLLPSQCLKDVVKFLSQVYYAATRAHKTNKLAQTTWTVLLHLLESHLGDQVVVALLDIFESADETQLESRIGYAQLAGALLIVSENLFEGVNDSEHSTIPSVTLTQLLDTLWPAVVNGTDSVRVAIMETMQTLLLHESAVVDLDAHCSWDLLLEVLEPCITLTPDDPGAKTLVKTLVSRAAHFEERNLPIVANLAIDLNLPLPASLSDAMLPLWEEVLPTRDTPNAFSRLLTKLCRSSQYTSELSTLIDRSAVDIFLRGPGNRYFATFVQTVQNLVIDPATTQDAADVLAQALVMMFRHTVRFPGLQQDLETLFQALCKTSLRCVSAAEAMFSIRADVEGSVYVESGLLSKLFPAHSESTSVSAVMHDASALPLHAWHDAILTVLDGQVEWNVYRCFLEKLPSHLGNHTMFDPRIDFILSVRRKACNLLESGAYPEPPPESGLTKSHVTVALLHILTAALSYHQFLSKNDTLEMVSIFLNIAGSRDYVVSTSCIHALTICCYELPDLMTSYMDDVIDKMSKLVTQRYLAIHVLLFLVGLSRQSKLFHNFQTHDFKKIFGVCGSYLQSIRGTSALDERPSSLPSDQTSSMSAESSDTLPQYVYALAHHTIAFWYLALKPHDRVLKEYITSCLRYTTASGQEIVEDQGLVTIDLMDGVDAAESGVASDADQARFEDLDGRITVLDRLSGLFLLTTETALRTGKTILTVRRATGTMRRVIEASGRSASVRATMEGSEDNFISIFPDDINGRTYGKILVPAPTSLLGSPHAATLPEDPAVQRAIQIFDRTSALDSHKAGVIYIGEGQSTEDEILQNCMGSPDYHEFVLSLGTLTRLKDAAFNTQGLDRMDNADGEHTIVWHNTLTELVFHLPTFMPNNEDVHLNTANKKKHIGNDYVNIVFNNSGSPFAMDTFPSQFNYVYIVITPSARTRFIQTRTQSTETDRKDRFYAVQVLTRAGYPTVSSAAEEKIISGSSLPDYVRNLALNECILSLMWAHREEPGEYPSSWRSRLLQIRRFWERYGDS
ncbi:hypothetical protein BDY17DRAFT_258521 [Neohortaea acidophila]|uniref:Rap-GAP domain-containing protein n=1 Tax=Neohortaea acidophila TaxID=245834 RepID=A0A6A6PFQ2_9PEZI|nr:uncharacterized protein BDY17DRAFT_258521 [Neohortaea acidophila]KAF2478809.1 hypothetical protein BDY17DRAFT_258521 [Neohortaea acidophila]